MKLNKQKLREIIRKELNEYSAGSMGGGSVKGTGRPAPGTKLPPGVDPRTASVGKNRKKKKGKDIMDIGPDPMPDAWGGEDESIKLSRSQLKELIRNGLREYSAKMETTTRPKKGDKLPPGVDPTIASVGKGRKKKQGHDTMDGGEIGPDPMPDAWGGQDEDTSKGLAKQLPNRLGGSPKAAGDGGNGVKTTYNYPPHCGGGKRRKRRWRPFK